QVFTALAQLHVAAANDAGVRLDDPADQLGQVLPPSGHVRPAHQVRLQRLQVDVNPVDVGKLSAKVALQLRCGGGGGVEGHVAGQLGVHGEVQAAVLLLLDSDVVQVSNDPLAVGGGMDAFHQV